MSSSSERRQVGRPTRAQAAQLDEAIRDAALELFIARGFDGVTMEEIARAAGVGKPALYARHPDKTALFTSVVPWALQYLRWEGPTVAAGTALRDALLVIARAALARAKDPMMIGLFRMAMAESPRFPDLALSADEITRSPLLRPVVDLLRAHGVHGAHGDLDLAAEHFISMVHLTPLTYAAFGFQRDAAADDDYLERTIDLFLSGVGPIR